MHKIECTRTEIVDTIHYQCETCGHKHDHPYSINKCAVCGKEICTECNPQAKTLCIYDNSFISRNDLDIDYQLEHLTYNVHKVYCCDACKSKFPSQKQYDSKVRKAAKQLFKAIKELNKEVGEYSNVSGNE